MFAPKSNRDQMLSQRRVSDITASMFTRNLYDLKYRAQGTGRDSYIYDNNGGFTCPNLPEQKQIREKMESPHRRSSISPKLASAIDTQRPLHYKGDGTGRDTYIQTTNGGFTGSGAATVA